MKTTVNTAADIAPRVRHLESDMQQIKETIAAVLGKLEQVGSSFARMEAQLAAHKPVNVLEWLRTGLQVMTTAVFLVGATVTAIVYVSSNANNADLVVLKERMAWAKERIQLLEQGAGRFAPRSPP